MFSSQTDDSSSPSFNSVDDSILPPASSPPPIKVPRQSPALPPVKGDALIIGKRRRLELSSPIGTADGSFNSLSDTNRNVSSPIPRYPHHQLAGSDNNSHDSLFASHITPAKQRSVTSPPKSRATRTPSLQDRPIPVLSPPTAKLERAHTPDEPCKSDVSITAATGASPKKKSSISPTGMKTMDIIGDGFMSENSKTEEDISGWYRIISIAETKCHCKLLEEPAKDQEPLDLQEVAQRAAHMLLGFVWGKMSSHNDDSRQALAYLLPEKYGPVNDPHEDDDNDDDNEQPLVNSAKADISAYGKTQFSLRQLLQELDLSYDALFPGDHSSPPATSTTSVSTSVSTKDL